VDGAKQMSANRARAKAEVLGDLFERQILIMTQSENHFLL
jgi:hypothetical protein